MAEPSTASPAPPAGPLVAVQPSETEPVTVREYGTRYLRITVRYHGDTGFSWLRAPGPAHTAPQRLPSAVAGAALRRVDTAVDTAAAGSHTTAEAQRGARLALGERAASSAPDGATRPGPPPGVLYRVPGAVSVARLLPSGDDTAFRLSVDALADLGRTLRRLHQEPWGLPERPPHHGVRRLLAWLSGEENAPGATRLRALARTRLGPSLWARLTTWSEAADEPPGGGNAVLLHGAPSTGWLVPSPAGGRTALLTGEEVTGGDPALDLGWVLGELHELRAAAARGLGSAGKGPQVDYPTAAHALLSGYTGGAGTAAVPRGTARAATLRLAVHMRDFASFVGWHGHPAGVRRGRPSQAVRETPHSPVRTGHMSRTMKSLAGASLLSLALVAYGSTVHAGGQWSVSHETAAASGTTQSVDSGGVSAPGVGNCLSGSGHEGALTRSCDGRVAGLRCPMGSGIA